VVYFILFFIAFICLFAFKFPRSGLVQRFRVYAVRSEAEPPRKLMLN
jgi:hypothetical protein